MAALKLLNRVRHILRHILRHIASHGLKAPRHKAASHEECTTPSMGVVTLCTCDAGLA
jgi:hypothetical protein